MARTLATGSWNRVIAALVIGSAVLSLATCVNVTPIRMPDSNMGYSISCPPIEAGTKCIEKAGELCPGGYQIAGSGNTFYSSYSSNGQFATASAFNRPQLMVECNGPSAASIDSDPMGNCLRDGLWQRTDRDTCRAMGGQFALPGRPPSQ